MNAAHPSRRLVQDRRVASALARPRVWLAVGVAVSTLTASTPSAAAQATTRPTAAQHERAVARAGSAETLEASRPSLRDIAKSRATQPSADNERRLADEYLAQGVLDAAFDHFQAALRLDAHDAHSSENIARIWRDWGFSNRGLSSAYRAVYRQPRSASSQNTLGTLLLKLGQIDAARVRFERAHQLDPDAAYPLNNLCYLLLGSGRPGEAVEMCRAAATADATSGQVRNNLALALAGAGDIEGAVAALETSPTTAAAAYNQSLLLLATQQPERARAALARSRISDPGFAPALRLLKRLAAVQAGY